VSWFDKLTMKTTVQSDEWKVMSRKRETSFSFHSPLVAHCFSLIVFTHYPLPIAHCPLLVTSFTTHYPLSTIHHPLSTIHHSPSTTLSPALAF